MQVRRGQCEKKRSVERQHLVQEHELRERYLESIYQCAEKVTHLSSPSLPQVMSKSQSSQLKALESLHSREANDVMKRLEQESKVEEQEKGSLASVSREELQRERRARLVKRGVTERNKLQVETSKIVSVSTPPSCRSCTRAGGRSWRRPRAGPGRS